MELVSAGHGLRRKTPNRNSPTVELLFSGYEEGPDVGVVKMSIPPQGCVIDLDHGGADVVLLMLTGAVEISSGELVRTLEAGDAALLRKRERASLRNRGEVDAVFIAAAGPSPKAGPVRISSAAG